MQQSSQKSLPELTRTKTPLAPALSPLPSALFPLLLLSCSAGISPEAKSTSGAPIEVPGFTLDLSLISLGEVSDAKEGFAHPLQSIPAQAVLQGALPPLEVDGSLHLPPDDARFQALAARTPALATKRVYTAYFPDGSRLLGETRGAVVFLGGCDQPMVAPLVQLPAPLPEERTPLLLYAGISERGPTVARMREPLRKLPRALRGFFAKRPIGKRAPRGGEALYILPLGLDGDSSPEYFVARAAFEPLGEDGARAAWLEGFWLDPDKGEVRVLAHEPPFPLPQEDIHSFSRSGGWELFLSPPVLLTDLDKDDRAEIVRQSVDGYDLWLFDGQKLIPTRVGYQRVCD